MALRAGILSTILLLGGCVQAAVEHPQVVHCKNALGWLVSPEDNVQVLSSERSASETGGASVSLGLRINGTARDMTCDYGDDRRFAGRVQATRIEIAQQTLTPEQLEAVNAAVTENRDPLRNLRRAL